MVITVEQILAKIQAGLIFIAQNKDYVEIPALKGMEGSIKRRIHNEGKDSNGDTIGIKGKRGGRYSPAYEKFKKKITGTENLYPINLQLDGDLIKGYGVGVNNGKNVIDFLDELSKKKIEKHETNYKTEIIKPSASDLEEFKMIYINRLKTVIRQAFSQ